jgi:hypothetical protein
MIYNRLRYIKGPPTAQGVADIRTMSPSTCPDIGQSMESFFSFS